MRYLVPGMAIITLGLSACSTPELTLVTQQPTYNKYGTAECDEGYILSVEGQYIDLCIPQEDECPEGYWLDTAYDDCVPYYRDDNDSSTSDDSSTGYSNNDRKGQFRII